MPRLEKCQSFSFTSVQKSVSPCFDVIVHQRVVRPYSSEIPSVSLDTHISIKEPGEEEILKTSRGTIGPGSFSTPTKVANPPPPPYPPCHPHSFTRMYILSNSGNLVNFTKLNWEHELSLPTSPIDAAEYLHHTLITIFLLESAAIYCSASLILQQLQREDAIYQQLSLRTIRFSAVAIIDACTILIHQVIFNAETQALYPLRLDALVLMCLNHLIFIFML